MPVDRWLAHGTRPAAKSRSASHVRASSSYAIFQSEHRITITWSFAIGYRRLMAQALVHRNNRDGSALSSVE